MSHKVKVKSFRCVQLCNPMDCSLPGSSIHGIFQARILEWVAISFSRESSQPRDWTQVSCTAGRLYHLSHQGSPKMSYNRWIIKPTAVHPRSVMSMGPQGLQHARLPCPSLSPGVCPSSCPLSQWCYETMVYYSLIKANGLLIHMTGMDLWGTMLSEENAYLKRWCSRWFHLYQHNILEMTTLKIWKTDEWLPGLGDGERGGYKGAARGRSLWQQFCIMIALVVTSRIKWHTSTHTHCTNICFPVLRLYHPHSRCTCWENLSEGSVEHLCITFTTSCESIITSKLKVFENWICSSHYIFIGQST